MHDSLSAILGDPGIRNERAKKCVRINLYRLIKTYPHTIGPHHIVPPQQPCLTFNNLGTRVLAESQNVGHNGCDHFVGLDTSLEGFERNQK